MPHRMQRQSAASTRQLARLNELFPRALRSATPLLFPLFFATAAHAQGTMDFSGAQTLMGTFKNFQLDRQVEPLVLESEISGLADLHAFMKYQNYVTRFSFPYFDMPVVANGFEARERPEDRLPYQPKRPTEPMMDSVELRQEPEPPAPVSTDGVSETEEIEPQRTLFPDDDAQSLITHG